MPSPPPNCSTPWAKKNPKPNSRTRDAQYGAPGRPNHTVSFTPLLRWAPASAWRWPRPRGYVNRGVRGPRVQIGPGRNASQTGPVPAMANAPGLLPCQVGSPDCVGVAMFAPGRDDIQLLARKPAHWPQLPRAAINFTTASETSSLHVFSARDLLMWAPPRVMFRMRNRSILPVSRCLLARGEPVCVSGLGVDVRRRFSGP